MTRLPVAIGVVLCAASVATPALAATVTVVLDGRAAAEGARMGALYTAEHFLEQPDATARGVAGATELVFHDVSPGRYAASAYIDANHNGRLDLDFFGAPTEPFAFSRDAMGRMGPPAFGDAAFDVGDEAVRITIRLR